MSTDISTCTLPAGHEDRCTVGCSHPADWEVRLDQLDTAVAAIREQFPEVVLAYWTRDEFTVDTEEGEVLQREVTDDEWDIAREYMQDAVYDAVGRSDCKFYAVEAAIKA